MRLGQGCVSDASGECGENEKAGEISFLGRRWEITPGDTKQVTIVQQPGSFRVIARPPTPQAPQWPDILAEYRL